VNAGHAAVASRLDCVNRSQRQAAEVLPMKGGLKEKKCSVLTLSRPRRNKVPRVPEPSVGRHRASRKAERENPKKERRLQGRNSLETILGAAPERNFRSRFVVVAAFVSNAVTSLSGRLAQASLQQFGDLYGV
jgi:hypothetical protein